MHLPTLIGITLLVNIMIGFYLFVLYQRRPKDRCFKLWAMSCACFVAGGSAAALRGMGLPPFISFFIADLLLLTAPVLLVLGLLQFSRFRFTKSRRQRSYWLYGLTVLFLLCAYKQPALISFVAAIAIAFTFFLATFLLKKSVFNEPIYTRTLQIIFILHSVTMISQATLICLQWDSIDIQGLPENSIYTLLSHIVLTTVTALLLPWLSFLKLERKLTLKSQRDGLTKLANREHFFNQAQRYWNEYPQQAVVLMMIDIDHFKAVNDQFGHSCGDLAIKSVASVLSMGLRSDDLIGRIGGEEFAAILTKLDFDTAQTVGKRLCHLVEQHCRIVGQEQLDITISIGLVQVIPAQHTMSAAFKVADDFLYHSKRNGRNTVTTKSLIESPTKNSLAM
jgi:diguanylate cyclase (GGDEF)-like protein